MDKIIYTHTDEAPALATSSLLPIIQRFAKTLGVSVVSKDISLSGRIISQFPDRLTVEQRQPDELARLGELAKTSGANIIKLPNISASIPQLLDAIKELQAKGYDIPHFKPNPRTLEEKDIAEQLELNSAITDVSGYIIVHSLGSYNSYINTYSLSMWISIPYAIRAYNSSFNIF